MENLKSFKTIFENCNNHKFLDKPIFWIIKTKILKSYGIFDGYDYKEIYVDCSICKTAKYYQKTCINCDGSGYKITRKYFLRYKLFDSIYHLPTNFSPIDKNLIINKITKKEAQYCPNRIDLYLGLIKLAIVFSPENLNEIVETIPGKECIEKYRDELRIFYKNNNNAA